MNCEIVLDLNNQKNLVNEINEIASNLKLDSKTIIDNGELIIIRYTGNADGIFSIGKYIGEKRYAIEIASK